MSIIARLKSLHPYTEYAPSWDIPLYMNVLHEYDTVDNVRNWLIENEQKFLDLPVHNDGGTGLLGWSGVRFTNLKQFSANWWHFSSQIAFILYELNTTHVDANIRILNSDVIDPAKGKSLGTIIGRYYAPKDGSYNEEVKRVYEMYANKKV